MVPLLLPEAPDMPQFPGLSIEPEEARSILRPQKDEAYGFGFALSPYRGCSHACRYCYLREYPHGRHTAADWGTWVAPKLNAPELLWQARHKLHDATVFISTGTDPYQPLEKHLGLTRKCLEVLLDCPSTRIIVHTRSPLVVRDLDLFKAFGQRLSVGLSIPTDDDTVRQLVEPKAPAIPSRWAAAEKLSRAGIRVHIAATPLLPMADPAAFGRQLRSCGASKVWVGRLRLMKDDPMQDLLARHGWLRALDPDYASLVESILSASLPMPRRSGRRRPGPPLAPPLPRRCHGPWQPTLFEGMG